MVDRAGATRQADEDSYANTVVINHRGKKELVLGGGTGADLDPSGVDEGLWWTSPPAGGQFDSNTQVAELVAMRRNTCFGRLVEVNFQGSTPGSWHMEFQTKDKTTIYGQPSGGSIDIISGPENPSYNVYDASYQGIVNDRIEWPGMLFETALTGYTAFNNATTGAGGGGQNPYVNNQYINFRKEFGQGPIFLDPNASEGLTTEGVINWSQIAGQTLEGKVVDTTYWDIHELKEPIDELEIVDV